MNKNIKQTENVFHIVWLILKVLSLKSLVLPTANCLLPFILLLVTCYWFLVTDYWLCSVFSVPGSVFRVLSFCLSQLTSNI